MNIIGPSHALFLPKRTLWITPLWITVFSQTDCDGHEWNACGFSPCFYLRLINAFLDQSAISGVCGAACVLPSFSEKIDVRQ
jgi:hypothetical protein